MTGTREGVSVDFTKVSTTKEHPLGIELNGLDGNTYVYCQAGETISAAQACILDEASSLLRVNTTRTASKPCVVAVPQNALASSEYGWAVVRGSSFNVIVAANCAADVKLYTTASSGTLDDSSSGTDLIQGIRINTANGGSTDIRNATAVSYMRVNAQD